MKKKKIKIKKKTMQKYKLKIYTSSKMLSKYSSVWKLKQNINHITRNMCSLCVNSIVTSVINFSIRMLYLKLNFIYSLTLIF